MPAAGYLGIGKYSSQKLTDVSYEVLQDPVTPLRLWQRFGHDPHIAYPTDIMSTGVFTKPLAPASV